MAGKEGGAVKRSLVFVILLALFCAMLPVVARANSAEPPAVTILVNNAPEDLQLTLSFPPDAHWPDGKTEVPIKMKSSQSGWESYYRFYYSQMRTGSFYDSVNYLEGVTITAFTGGQEQVFALPQRPTDDAGRGQYNLLLTLNLEQGTLSWNNPMGRVVLLISLRLGLTLLLEGLVFFACGYRARRSWLVFLLTNLITQGLLNWMLLGTGWNFAMLFYIVGEVLVFAAEMLVFALLVRERGRGAAVLTAFLTNLVSLTLGGILLAFLPL